MKEVYHLFYLSSPEYPLVLPVFQIAETEIGEIPNSYKNRIGRLFEIPPCITMYYGLDISL